MDPVWIAGGAAVISSGAAIWSATNGNRTLRRSDRDSQARTRPMVAAELRDEAYARGVQLLVIKNYGPTVARNVKVIFDPPLGDPASEKEHQSVAPFLKRRYAKPISSLVPGQELDNIYFDGESDGAGGFKNRDPHPDQVRVTIELDAPDGAHYVDHFDLDVNLIRDRTMVTSSRHPEERLKQAVKALEGINKTLARIAQTAPKARQARQTAEENASLIERRLGRSREDNDDKHADDRQATRHDPQDRGGDQA
jgi:hypothetical protein